MSLLDSTIVFNSVAIRHKQASMYMLAFPDRAPNKVRPNRCIFRFRFHIKQFFEAFKERVPNRRLSFTYFVDEEWRVLTLIPIRVLIIEWVVWVYAQVLGFVRQRSKQRFLVVIFESSACLLRSKGKVISPFTFLFAFQIWIPDCICNFGKIDIQALNFDILLIIETQSVSLRHEQRWSQIDAYWRHSLRVLVCLRSSIAWRLLSNYIHVFHSSDIFKDSDLD